MFFKKRSGEINHEELENFKPSDVKPKKRKQKEDNKKKEDTTLLNVKTGEEVDENASLTDNKSTIPSSITWSSKKSESVMSEKGDPQASQKPEKFKEPKKKSKATQRTLLVQKLSEEWKNLPQEQKKVYQEEAKKLMKEWKQEVLRAHRNNMRKAEEKRDGGTGVVKNQRYACLSIT